MAHDQQRQVANAGLNPRPRDIKVHPLHQYNQAVARDFVAGGMENTTLTILTDGTLHSKDSQPIRSSQSLVAHELVHQWFGDYVTCKDWSHLWLNEGFAVYYEDLYDGHKNGRDSMLANLYATPVPWCVRAANTSPLCTMHTHMQTSSSTTAPIARAAGSCTCCAPTLAPSYSATV